VAARTALFPTFAVATLAIVAPAPVVSGFAVVLPLAPAAVMHRIVAMLAITPAPVVPGFAVVLAFLVAPVVSGLAVVLTFLVAPGFAVVLALLVAPVVHRIVAVLPFAPAPVVHRAVVMFPLAWSTVVHRVAAMLPLAPAPVVRRIAAVLVVPGVGASSLAVMIPVFARPSSLAVPLSLSASRTLVRTVAAVFFVGLRTGPVQAGQRRDQRSRPQFPEHRIPPLAEVQECLSSPLIRIASKRAWMAWQKGRSAVLCKEISRLP
jgi:hypothetical protein